ncbi:MAG: hypothetical protein ABIO39_11835, partial [Caulobacteraceae bacterium]
VGLFSLVVDLPDPALAPAPASAAAEIAPKAEPLLSAPGPWGDRMITALSRTRVWGGLTAYMAVSVLIVIMSKGKPNVWFFLLASTAPLAGLICRALVKRGLTRPSSLVPMIGASLGFAGWILLLLTNGPRKIDIEALVSVPLVGVLFCLIGVIVFGLGALLVVVLRQPAVAER